MRKSRVVRLWEKEVEEAIAEIFEGVEEEIKEVVKTVKNAIPFWRGIYRNCEKLFVPVLRVIYADNNRNRFAIMPVPPKEIGFPGTFARI